MYGGHVEREAGNEAGREKKDAGKEREEEQQDVYMTDLPTPVSMRFSPSKFQLDALSHVHR